MNQAAEAQEKSPAAKSMGSEAVEKPVTKSSKAEVKKAMKLLTSESQGSGDLISETAASVELMDQESALALIPDLVNSIEFNFFKLGGLLCRVQEEGWWKETGVETFKAYLDAEHGLGYRKAMYLIDIYKALVQAEVKWELVKDVGWTKLRVISPCINAENVDEWVARAKSMTTIQLEEFIKALKKSDGEEGSSSVTTNNIVSKVFKLHSDQKEIIEAALDKCKHDKKTEHDNVALQYVCEEWLSGASGKKAVGNIDAVEVLKGIGLEKTLEVLNKAFPEADFEVSV